MTNEELIKTLTAEDHEIKSLKHRVDKLEQIIDQINDLTISVHDIANSMKQMLEEQKSQSSRLEVLESKPAEAWSTIQKTILTAVVSACAGGLTVWIVHGLAQYI